MQSTGSIDISLYFSKQHMDDNKAKGQEVFLYVDARDGTVVSPTSLSSTQYYNDERMLATVPSSKLFILRDGFGQNVDLIRQMSTKRMQVLSDPERENIRQAVSYYQSNPQLFTDAAVINADGLYLKPTVIGLYPTAASSLTGAGSSDGSVSGRTNKDDDSHLPVVHRWFRGFGTFDYQRDPQ